ncbi:glutathione S-transferase [Pyronema omphalodes]|nr:glutathione S-transferase [Pyronema omphalodes]
MSSPQFTLYSHIGPNPWKVVFILEELGLTYKLTHVDTSKNEHKQEPYTLLNPNGRMPTLVDHHNNDFTIWESGAIMLYLIEKYDTQKKLSFEKFESEALAKQYLMFQMSGQGPYFGQAVWFEIYHPEKLPSAAERYMAEIKRIVTVLNTILEGRNWLVEDKCSYADLSFVPWMWLFDWPAMKMGNWREVPEYKNVVRWYDAMEAMECVKKAKEIRAASQKPSA